MGAMVVDVHTHILPPAFRRRRQRLLRLDTTFGELFARPKVPMATAEELMEVMDTDGVAVAVVMGYNWCDQGVAREANDYLLDAAKRFPGRIIPFCSVNPAWGSAALLEAERCVALGARGIGELQAGSGGFDLGDRETMEPIMGLAEASGLIIVTHASEPVGHSYNGKGSTTPDVLMRFIINFPRVPIVCAHWGGGLPFYALMPEIQTAMQNVFFDSAASPLLYVPEVFRTVVQLVGAERVLLGSDYPMVRPGHLLEMARHQVPNSLPQSAILGLNALRLLGLTQGHG